MQATAPELQLPLCCF